jgi:hypothetical protein
MAIMPSETARNRSGRSNFRCMVATFSLGAIEDRKVLLHACRFGRAEETHAAELRARPRRALLRHSRNAVVVTINCIPPVRAAIRLRVVIANRPRIGIGQSATVQATAPPERLDPRR